MKPNLTIYEDAWELTYPDEESAVRAAVRLSTDLPGRVYQEMCTVNLDWDEREPTYEGLRRVYIELELGFQDDLDRAGISDVLELYAVIIEAVRNGDVPGSVVS